MGKKTRRKARNKRTKVQRTYKDRLFRMLFGSEQYKGSLLELYNALNHCNYTDADELEITTIENVIYIGMKNDVSFLLHGYMALYEHQSTYNPNMPLRGLLYIAKLYQKYIKRREYNIFGETLIQIPAPMYVVFYNGEDDVPERSILKLSDAFENPVEEGTFEWTATMLNINYGKNKELMEHCNTLKEYSVFVDKCRKYRKKCDSVEEAVNKAVDECIQEDVLKEFLVAHRGEVLDVLLTEFDEAIYRKGIRKEGFEEGIEKGIEKGIVLSVQVAMECGETVDSAIEKSARRFDMPQDRVRELWKEYQVEKNETILN